MYTTVFKLIKLTDSKGFKKLALLVFIMVLSAFAEIFSIGAILPFISILSNPNYLYDSELFGLFSDSFLFGKISPITFFTLLFVFGIVVSTSLRLALLWLNAHITFHMGKKLSVKVYKSLLYRSYQEHISENSSKGISVVTTLCNSLVYNVINPVFTIISSALIIISILCFLIYINTNVAIITFGSMALFYGLIIIYSHRKFAEYSIIIKEQTANTYKCIQEGLGGFREIQLDSTHDFFLSKYEIIDFDLKTAQQKTLFLNQFPKYLLEALGMLSIIGAAFFASNINDPQLSILPILGAIALGSQKLLPLLQQAYSAWANIAASKSALLEVIKYLDNDNQPYYRQDPIVFNKSITFKNVFFRYNGNKADTVNSLSLKIIKGDRIGVVGISGGGKSTFADLLMGLLPITSGEILIDDKNLSTSLTPTWMKLISHVPQNIFLADTNILENITFGVEPQLVNMNKLNKVIEQSQLTNLINRLPNGIYTLIGERGVQISGGERQRIGIARALYKNSELIIFDEATSALDSQTEESILNTINLIDKDVTLVIIAHRVSTLANCDYILKFVNGTVEIDYEKKIL